MGEAPGNEDTNYKPDAEYIKLKKYGEALKKAVEDDKLNVVIA